MIYAENETDLTAAMNSKTEWEPEFDHQIKTEIKIDDVFYYAGNFKRSNIDFSKCIFRK